MLNLAFKSWMVSNLDSTEAMELFHTIWKASFLRPNLIRGNFEGFLHKKSMYDDELKVD